MKTKGVPVSPLARSILEQWAQDPEWPVLVARIEEAISDMTMSGRMMKSGKAQAEIWPRRPRSEQPMALVHHGGWDIETWARAGKGPRLEACLENDDIYLDESTLIIEKVIPTAAQMAVYQERADKGELRLSDIADIDHIGDHLVVKVCLPEKNGKFTIQHRPERQGETWWDGIAA